MNLIEPKPSKHQNSIAFIINRMQAFKKLKNLPEHASNCLSVFNNKNPILPQIKDCFDQLPLVFNFELKSTRTRSFICFS